MSTSEDPLPDADRPVGPQEDDPVVEPDAERPVDPDEQPSVMPDPERPVPPDEGFDAAGPV